MALHRLVDLRRNVTIKRKKRGSSRAKPGKAKSSEAKGRVGSRNVNGDTLLDCVGSREFKRFTKLLEKEGKQAIKAMQALLERTSTLKSEDANLQMSIETLRYGLATATKETREQLNRMLRNATWDEPTISFFGETNAGKSTLIQALTRGSAAPLGDGRKDFTRRQRRVQLGKNRLVDMPGIEGNEAEINDEIRCAVAASHVVCFVTNSDKPVEQPTFERVKQYLCDETVILSICNVRGYPSECEPFNDSVFSRDARETASENQKIFSHCFKSRYRGNVMVHALMAFAARGKPGKHKRHVSYKEKWLRQTAGDRARLLRASGLPELEAKIQMLVADGPMRTCASNARKIQGCLGRSFDVLEKGREVIEEIETQATKTIQDNKRRVVEACSAMEKALLHVIDEQTGKMRAALYEDVRKNINLKRSKEEVKKSQAAISKSYRQTIKKECNKNMEAFHEELRTIQGLVNARLEVLSVTSVLGPTSINLDEVFRRLEVRFSDVLKEVDRVMSDAVDVVRMALVNLVAGIGLAVMKVGRLIKKWFFKDPERRVNEAIAEANKKIGKEVDKIRTRANKKVKVGIAEKKSEIQMILDGTEQFGRRIGEFATDVGKIMSELECARGRILTALCGLLYQGHVKYAGADPEFARLIVIGEVDTDRIAGIVGAEQVYAFPSVSHARKSVKDEATARAVKLIEILETEAERVKHEV